MFICSNKQFFGKKISLKKYIFTHVANMEAASFRIFDKSNNGSAIHIITFKFAKYESIFEFLALP